jgi:acyl-CoA synthetase (AMP-forming)/AMP-acid ligase II
MYLRVGGLRRGMLFLSSKSSAGVRQHDPRIEGVRKHDSIIPTFFLSLPSYFALPAVNGGLRAGRRRKKEKREQRHRTKLTPSLPMTWQATAAFLACARIGAVHSAVFAGFSAESLRDRVKDCDCKVVITTEYVPFTPKLEWC